MVIKSVGRIGEKIKGKLPSPLQFKILNMTIICFIYALELTYNL